MNFDFSIFDEYPDIMNKEQMHKVCKISKTTARFLLESGIVPCVDTGKKTHRFLIKKEDIIRYIKDKECHPGKYKAPALWYKDGASTANLSNSTFLCSADLPYEKIRKYYEQKLDLYNELMTVDQIRIFTGFSKTAVNGWIANGHLKYLDCIVGKMIPKEWFVDFLCSDWFNSDRRKPDRTKKYITEISKNVKIEKIH